MSSNIRPGPGTDVDPSERGDQLDGAQSGAAEAAEEGATQESGEVGDPEQPSQ